MIGVYGSVITGDEYEKSDLDLMILINDENGQVLADGFIIDDVDIGYDLYCTSWDMLEKILAVIQAETVEKVRERLTEVFVLINGYLQVPKKKELYVWLQVYLILIAIRS